MPYFLAPIWYAPIDELNDEELWVHFEECLVAHDWYHAMSDDSGVVRAGEEQRVHLRKAFERAREIDLKRADLMYCIACPWLTSEGEYIDNSQ